MELGIWLVVVTQPASGCVTRQVAHRYGTYIWVLVPQLAAIQIKGTNISLRYLIFIFMSQYVLHISY